MKKFPFFFTLFLLLILPVCSFAEDGIHTLISPGDLASAHAKYEGIKNCTKCHRLGSGIPDSTCLECHDKLAAKIKNKQGLHARFTGTCVKCHSDHKGRKYKMIIINESDFDHDRTDYRLVDKHKKVSCSKCHKTKGIYVNTPKECASCHNDVHKKQLSRDCAKCHNIKDWKDIEKFNHGRDSAYALTWKHKDVKCAKCHETGKYKPVAFKKCEDCHKDPHTRQFAGKLCDSCHTTKDWKEETFKHGQPSYNGYKLDGKHLTTPCEKCHVKGRYRPIESKGCNAAGCHDNPHKKQFEGKTCESCHVTSGWKDNAFDHNSPRYKGYKLEGKHLKTSCDKCHVKGSYKPIQHKFCLDCHKDEHKGQFKEKTCESCHTVKDWKETSFDHNSPKYKGYRLDGKHLKTTCDKCHVKGVYKPIKYAACADCHKDEHKGQFPGKTCESCHTTKDWKKSSFDHNAPSYKGYRLDGKHLKTACDKCHVNGKYRPIPDACLTCHEKEDVHKKELGNVCQRCHSTVDWKKYALDHNAQARFPLIGKHKTVECAKCHKPSSGKIRYRTNELKCADCHKDVHKGKFKEECSSCHTQFDWAPRRYDHKQKTGFTLSGVHNEIICNSCHKSSEYKKVNRMCSQCHTDPHRNQFGKTECSQCHAQSSWAPMQFRHNSNTGYQLAGAHRNAECGECHNNGQYRNTPTVCINCHLNTYSSAPNHLSKGFSQDCSSCHLTSFSSWSFKHPDASGNCSSCHLAKRPATHVNSPSQYPVTCNNCHKYPSWAASSFNHTGATNCSSCHLSKRPATHTANTAKYPTTCEQCHKHPSWTPSTLVHSSTLNCSTCHMGQRPASHTADPVKYPTTCSNCHKYPSWSGATVAHTSTTNCSSCHLSKRPATHTANTAKYPTTCEQCHKYPSWTPSTLVHSSTLSCSTCHMGQRPASHTADPLKYPTTCSNCHKYPSWSGATVAHTSTTNCSSCHLSKRPATHTANTAKYPTTCEQCHKYPSWTPSTLVHSSTLSCSTCHMGQRPASHTADPLKYPTTCSNCHKYPSWSGATVAHTSTTNCSSCHLSSRPSSHASNPAKYPTTCELCHKYPSWTFLHPTGTTSTCNNCHAGNTPAPHKTYTIRFGTVCQNCHVYPSWLPGKMNHSFTAFPVKHKGYSMCSDCHPSYNYGNKGGCIECHSAQGEQVHKTTVNSGCLNCHPTGN